MDAINHEKENRQCAVDNDYPPVTPVRGYRSLIWPSCAEQAGNRSGNFKKFWGALHIPFIERFRPIETLICTIFPPLRCDVKGVERKKILDAQVQYVIHFGSAICSECFRSIVAVGSLNKSGGLNLLTAGGKPNGGKVKSKIRAFSVFFRFLYAYSSLASKVFGFYIKRWCVLRFPTLEHGNVTR